MFNAVGSREPWEGCPSIRRRVATPNPCHDSSDMTHSIRFSNTDPDTDAVIMALAARQHGVVARWQLANAGVPLYDVEYRAKKGRLRRIHRGIYMVGPVAGPLARVMAAVLACGESAVLSHGSAVALWQMTRPARPRRRNGALHADAASNAAPRNVAHRTVAHRNVAMQLVDVSTRRGHRRFVAGVRIHRVVTLQRDELALLDGVPITRPARSLFDLAGIIAGRELEQALAHAYRRGVTNPAEVERMVARYPHRVGSIRLRALLACDAGPAFTRSEAETLFLALIRKAQLRPPEANVVVRGCEVDFF
ncbi:hypothetical protein BH23GEM9_BH23GEM9_28940 [soil metagenome]